MLGVSVFRQGHAAHETAEPAFLHVRFGLVIGGLFLLFAGDGENAVIKLDVDIFRGNAGKLDRKSVV